ncbi:MAG: 3-hydroxyacyl-CoA dehydrogenase NAD-binding domain-containing protein [Pseudohongiellaceae bacterium]
MSATVASYLESRLRQEPDKQSDYRHWHTEQDEQGVLWLYFDKADSSTNTLDAEVLEEFGRIIESAPGESTKAVVLRSLKAGGFCAGADIGQFTDFSEEQGRELLQEGHRILDQLEKLRLPTVAVVHGHCLGGGLELALACDLRIGLAGKLEMGFPEIQLGLHPGLGGTFRLTELVDPLAAMTMMLTGKSSYDKQNLSRGLVDVLVPERHLHNAVSAALAGKLKKRQLSLRGRLMTKAPVRKLAAARMRSETGKRAPAEHYPAPYRLIDLWENHGGERKAMQRAEIDSFISLLGTDTSRNLVRVFFLREGLKQAARGTTNINHVHVIGAGAMGGDIAAWCALQGFRVTLSDVDNKPIARAIKSVGELCRSKHRSNIETRDTYDRLIPDPKGQGIALADLVIEAAPENPELKQKIFADVEPQLKQGAILASNTSSIPLNTLASYLKNPKRLVGIHFFNPVPKMLIVEVVSHKKIDRRIRDQAMTFTNAIGKLPVAVQSYPGFLVNRALTPYLLEAIMLLDEGVDKQRIDQAALDFGMPMGPVELADQVGLDICLHVADVLRDSLDTPMPEVPKWLQEKVDRGNLGRKSGQGFYKWKNGKAQKNSGDDDSDLGSNGVSGPTDSKTLQDRLLLPMLNACVECHRQKVVASLDDLDAAMIFATGFAPFRGGPMHYARTRGVDRIVATLEQLQEDHGARFKPDPGWQDLQ